MIMLTMVYLSSNINWNQINRPTSNVSLVIFFIKSSSSSLQPSYQDTMSTVKVAANHWYIHICLRHRQHTMMTFLQNLSYRLHVRITSDFHVRMWRGCWWSLSWQGSQAVDGSLSLHFSICKCYSTRSFEGHLRTISSCVCDDQNRYFKPKLDVFLNLTMLFCT